MPFGLSCLLARRRRSIPPRRRPALRRIAASDPVAFPHETRAALDAIVEEGLASSSCLAYRRHVAFFLEFFALIGLDIPLFGAHVALEGLTFEQEETVLAAFAVHARRCPSRGHRSVRRFNTGRHCQACVNAVRDWFYDAHRRIIAPLERSPFLSNVLRGFRKRAPSG
jgi:hypothetical protein